MSDPASIIGGEPATPEGKRLRLQVHLGEHDASVRLAGAMCEPGLARFSTEIMRLLRTRIYRRVIIDMAAVCSCDALALLVLSELADFADEAGGEIVLVNPSPAVEGALAAGRPGSDSRWPRSSRRGESPLQPRSPET